MNESSRFIIWLLTVVSLLIIVRNRPIFRSSLVPSNWISFDPNTLLYRSVLPIKWYNQRFLREIDAPTMSLIMLVHAFISLSIARVDVHTYIININVSSNTEFFCLILYKMSNLTSTWLEEVPSKSISSPVLTCSFRMMYVWSEQPSEAFKITFSNPSFNKGPLFDIYPHSFSVRY